MTVMEHIVGIVLSIIIGGGGGLTLYNLLKDKIPYALIVLVCAIWGIVAGIYIVAPLVRALPL